MAGIPVRVIGGNFASGDLKTDAKGEFELTRFPWPNGLRDLPCVLVCDADLNLAVAQELDEETTNLVLKLEPGLTLAGRVESDGKPLSNVTAQLVFWSDSFGQCFPGMARTNTPGRYEIPALPPGRKYGVIVSAAGYSQRQNHNLEISTEPGRQELDPVELKPATLRLAGQLVDSDDKPVARCNVSIGGDEQPNESTRTDRDGRFSFAHVCEGPVQVSAISQRSEGSVSAQGGDTNVVLRLGQTLARSTGTVTHKLKGTVTDPDGQPAVGVQVGVFPNGPRWVKTGTNGAYSLTWSLESYQAASGGACLLLRDKPRNLAAVEILSEETTTLDVKLQPALVLSGQVKNADGAPLPGARVTFQVKSASTLNLLDEQPALPVTADGRFEIKCLPADLDYFINASAKGFGRHQYQARLSSETNRVELEPFVLNQADRVIAGVVLRNDNQPAFGVEVLLNSSDQPEGSLIADSRGRFHFAVCDGPVSLYAYSRGGAGSASLNVEAGDTNIVLTLGRFSSRAEPPRRVALKGKPLPNLASLGLTAADVPAGQPLLVLLIDAEQRPSRRTLKVLTEQADALKAKQVGVLIVQAGAMADAAYAAWLQEAALPFPIARLKDSSENGRAAWGAAALPWLILADSAHKVVAEGIAADELDGQLKPLLK